MSAHRVSMMNGGSKKLWQLKKAPLHEQGKYQELIAQSILAAFYADPNGAPLKSHQWPGVIKDLFERIFKRSPETMPEGSVKGVCPFDSFLIHVDKATSDQLLFQNEIVCRDRLYFVILCQCSSSS